MEVGLSTQMLPLRRCCSSPTPGRTTGIVPKDAQDGSYAAYNQKNFPSPCDVSSTEYRNTRYRTTEFVCEEYAHRVARALALIRESIEKAEDPELCLIGLDEDRYAIRFCALAVDGWDEQCEHESSRVARGSNLPSEQSRVIPMGDARKQTQSHDFSGGGGGLGVISTAFQLGALFAPTPLLRTVSNAVTAIAGSLDRVVTWLNDVSSSGSGSGSAGTIANAAGRIILPGGGGGVGGHINTAAVNQAESVHHHDHDVIRYQMKMKSRQQGSSVLATATQHLCSSIVQSVFRYTGDLWCSRTFFVTVEQALRVLKTDPLLFLVRVSELRPCKLEAKFVSMSMLEKGVRRLLLAPHQKVHQDPSRFDTLCLEKRWSRGEGAAEILRRSLFLLQRIGSLISVEDVSNTSTMRSKDQEEEKKEAVFHFALESAEALVESAPFCLLTAAFLLRQDESQRETTATTGGTSTTRRTPSWIVNVGRKSRTTLLRMAFENFVSYALSSSVVERIGEQEQQVEVPAIYLALLCAWSDIADVRQCLGDGPWHWVPTLIDAVWKCISLATSPSLDQGRSGAFLTMYQSDLAELFGILLVQYGDTFEHAPLALQGFCEEHFWVQVRSQGGGNMISRFYEQENLNADDYSMRPNVEVITTTTEFARLMQENLLPEPVAVDESIALTGSKTPVMHEGERNRTGTSGSDRNISLSKRTTSPAQQRTAFLVVMVVARTALQQQSPIMSSKVAAALLYSVCHMHHSRIDTGEYRALLASLIRIEAGSYAESVDDFLMQFYQPLIAFATGTTRGPPPGQPPQKTLQSLPFTPSALMDRFECLITILCSSSIRRTAHSMNYMFSKSVVQQEDKKEQEQPAEVNMHDLICSPVFVSIALDCIRRAAEPEIKKIDNTMSPRRFVSIVLQLHNFFAARLVVWRTNKGSLSPHQMPHFLREYLEVSIRFCRQDTAGAFAPSLLLACEVSELLDLALTRLLGRLEQSLSSIAALEKSEQGGEERDVGEARTSRSTVLEGFAQLYQETDLPPGKVDEQSRKLSVGRNSAGLLWLLLEVSRKFLIQGQIWELLLARGGSCGELARGPRTSGSSFLQHLHAEARHQILATHAEESKLGSCI
ncbi:unnamed protein product [Amoebophrya sp. A25]|nr:unnamed protein product [Amoebophrya sp. A25]|eukprot:GSA25T00004666001.1